MALEGIRDFAHVLLDCGVARAQRLKVVLRLEEKMARPGLLLLVEFKVFERHDERANVVANLAEVVVARRLGRARSENSGNALGAHAVGKGRPAVSVMSTIFSTKASTFLRSAGEGTRRRLQAQAF